MRILIIACIAGLLSGFKPVKPVVSKNKDFQVVSASSQATFGGVAGSPVTTLYKVRIKALRSFTLTSDSAFAEGRIEKFHILRDSFSTVSSLSVKKGKTIEIVFEVKTETEMGGSDYQLKIPGSRVAKPPFANENGVIIRYKGGKSKYLIIKKIEKKPDILMP